MVIYDWQRGRLPFFVPPPGSSSTLEKGGEDGVKHEVKVEQDFSKLKCSVDELKEEDKKSEIDAKSENSQEEEDDESDDLDYSEEDDGSEAGENEEEESDEKVELEDSKFQESADQVNNEEPLFKKVRINTMGVSEEKIKTVKDCDETKSCIDLSDSSEDVVDLE
jgi:nuclear GTP-binding protein